MIQSVSPDRVELLRTGTVGHGQHVLATDGGLRLLDPLVRWGHGQDRSGEPARIRSGQTHGRDGDGVVVVVPDGDGQVRECLALGSQPVHEGLDGGRVDAPGMTRHPGADSMVSVSPPTV